MSQMSQPPPDKCDMTTAVLVERIAKETACLPNWRAWPEIWGKLRAAGRSARRATELRREVWAARKQNAATARAAKTGGKPPAGNRYDVMSQMSLSARE
jgi:hypothetical protein